MYMCVPVLLCVHVCVVSWLATEVFIGNREGGGSWPVMIRGQLPTHQLHHISWGAFTSISCTPIKYYVYTCALIRNITTVCAHLCMHIIIVHYVCMCML